MSIVDPADESIITTQCPSATFEDVDVAVAAAKRAFVTWGKTTGRCALLWRACTGAHAGSARCDALLAASIAERGWWHLRRR
jgi:acyl-CoA reductase-like NAD-dependent aldehyde dehydrogenase